MSLADFPQCGLNPTAGLFPLSTPLLAPFLSLAVGGVGLDTGYHSLRAAIMLRKWGLPPDSLVPQLCPPLQMEGCPSRAQ